MINLIQMKEILEIDLTSPSGLRWKVDIGRRIKSKSVAGCLDKSRGYFVIGINTKTYQNHRIVYALYHNLELNQLPKGLDHVDRNKTNNNPLNLRPATQSQNMDNTGIRPDNTSGIRGVSWFKRDQKWRSLINVDGKSKHLGLFDDIEEAKKAYEAASLKYKGEYSYICTHLEV